MVVMIWLILQKVEQNLVQSVQSGHSDNSRITNGHTNGHSSHEYQVFLIRQTKKNIHLTWSTVIQLHVIVIGLNGTKDCLNIFFSYFSFISGARGIWAKRGDGAFQQEWRGAGTRVLLSRVAFQVLGDD